MRKHRINHDQYRAATKILVDTIKQGEESLLWDVFFEAESTDIGNHEHSGSPEAIEGPFYLPGAPELKEAPHVLPMRPDERGEVLYFIGRVTDGQGQAIAGAELDVWHADADGLYANIHPSVPPWNLRGRFKTDASGEFEVRTIVPPPYEIPKDGPTGKVLNVMGRHFFRPAHLHVKVRHPNFGEMTSQIYFAGGEYLDSDVANAVRDGLVAPLEHYTDGAAIRERGLGKPFYTVRYDFELARS
jgi:catechol 1,2-dioxygenase